MMIDFNEYKRSISTTNNADDEIVPDGFEDALNEYLSEFSSRLDNDIALDAKMHESWYESNPDFRPVDKMVPTKFFVVAVCRDKVYCIKDGDDYHMAGSVIVANRLGRNGSIYAEVTSLTSYPDGVLQFVNAVWSEYSGERCVKEIYLYMVDDVDDAPVNNSTIFDEPLEGADWYDIRDVMQHTREDYRSALGIALTRYNKDLTNANMRMLLESSDDIRKIEEGLSSDPEFCKKIVGIYQKYIIMTNERVNERTHSDLDLLRRFGFIDDKSAK